MTFIIVFYEHFLLINFTFIIWINNMFIVKITRIYKELAVQYKLLSWNFCSVWLLLRSYFRNICAYLVEFTIAILLGAFKNLLLNYFSIVTYHLLKELNWLRWEQRLINIDCKKAPYKLSFIYEMNRYILRNKTYTNV